jgi:hypothetical protein
MQRTQRDYFQPLVIDRERQCFRHPAAVQQTPTTLFSDFPITTSVEYNRVVKPERIKLLCILALLLVITPLVFRYACGSSDNNGVNSNAIPWASALDVWEWVILIVLWLNVLGLIFRLLPMITGCPSAVQSSRVCTLDGVVALGCSSPFSSEDDTILLRSLLGRTCTVFHTTGGRHAIQGLYVDAILNERRIKGEAQRRNAWLGWMKFLHALVDVTLLVKEERLAAAAKKAEKQEHEGEGSETEPVDLGSPALSRAEETRPTSASGHYRPLYTQGDQEGRIVTKEPFQEPRSPPQSFRDVGVLLDSTRNVPEEKRQRVVSWGQNQVAAGPLSRGYSIASPGSSPRAGTNSTSGGPDRMLSGGGSRGLRARLEQIAEQEDEEKELDDEDAPRPVSSALETEEVDDDDIEMAALRCSRDPADHDQSHPVLELFSDKAQEPQNKDDMVQVKAQDKNREGGEPSGRRISPAISSRQHTASGTYRRVSREIPIDLDLSAHQQKAPSSKGLKSHADFIISPSKSPRPLSTRETIISTAYLRPHGLANLELNLSDLIPMIHFLDAWLQELKQYESGFDYFNPR